MKKVFYTLISVLALAGVCFAVWGAGYGAVKSATTTPQVLTLDEPANVVSVYNSGTNDVYCLVQNTIDSTVVTTGTLATAISTTNAVPIPAAVAFSFDCREKGSIKKLFYATSSGSSTIYISAY